MIEKRTIAKARSQPAQISASPEDLLCITLSLLRMFSFGDVLDTLLLLAYTDKAPQLGRPDPDISTPRHISSAFCHCLPRPSESYRVCCWLPSFLSHQIQLYLIFSFFICSYSNFPSLACITLQPPSEGTQPVFENTSLLHYLQLLFILPSISCTA